jgi:hypothetical protein
LLQVCSRWVSPQLHDDHLTLLLVLTVAFVSAAGLRPPVWSQP